MVPNWTSKYVARRDHIRSLRSDQQRDKREAASEVIAHNSINISETNVYVRLRHDRIMR
jgi:hypothetical protein